LRLDPSGNNLVSVLHQLANEPRYDAINERLINVFQIVFPDFLKFDIPISAGGTGSLSYRSRYLNKSVPALSMSDGQLRFLGLVTLLLLPNPPSLIAIDEPEIGLHPQMLDILVELLCEASERTQLIISTHSTRLLDFAQPEEVIVVDQNEGETTFERVDIEKLQVWLDRYKLGTLWTMGKLDVR
jgi:predicted ATPase